MELEGISLQEKRDYDSLLYIYADTKRLYAVEYVYGKKKILLNKEREVRKTNAGGMAKKKYRRHYEHLIKKTSAWHIEQLEKIQKEKYDYLKLDVEDEKQKEIIFNFLKKRITNRKWFEKYRPVKLNNGIIVGGKDKETNEELLKHHLDKEDLVFHTEMKGSPFFILKENKEEIKKTALLTAYYSQDWKKNKRDVKVTWCKGDQVYKQKEMNTGTFGVRGKREIIIIRKEELINFKVLP